MIIFISLLAPFIISCLAPALYRRFQRLSVYLFTSLPLALFVVFLSLQSEIVATKSRSVLIPWVPSLGIHISLLVDGLSLMFLYLVLGIGSLVMLYAWGYFKSKARIGEFYSYFFLFMGSMMGLVLANNLIMIFLFWELTSLASYLLIGFNHQKSEARIYSQQALLTTGFGGIALLAGFIMLGEITGTYEVQEIFPLADQIKANPGYPILLSLILIGAFTKSAQWPFHFWLPNAMEAPTPVSAYLHSATMVKAGIYLLARLSPALAGTPIWEDVLTYVGLLTAVTGSILALRETDLKKLLAYSTVGALGLMVFLLGLGTPDAVEAALVYLFVHSLYKGALFMIAGVVDQMTGSRDVIGLSGLYQVMPFTAVASLIAALSMAGVPPLFGFIGKEMLYHAKLSAPNVSWLVYLFSMAANIAMVAIAFIVGVEPFTGKRITSPRPVHEGSLKLLTGPSFLALLSVVFALMPGNLIQSLLSAAVSSTLSEPHQVILKLWHGFNLVFVFSMLTVIGGLIIFFKRDQIRIFIENLPPLTKFGPERIYYLSLKYLLRYASWQTAAVHNGKLGQYLVISFTSVIAFLVFLIGRGQLVIHDPPLSDTPYEIMALLGVMMLAALVAPFSTSRILIATCMSFIGFSLAVFYVYYSAPDVSSAQVLVEIISVIWVVFLFLSLPPLRQAPPFRMRIRNVVVAFAFGTLMGLLTFVGMQEQKTRLSISPYFIENSYEVAQGRNVVNVLLVDFRALDTLGEITVMALAAFGVTSLLRKENP